MGRRDTGRPVSEAATLAPRTVGDVLALAEGVPTSQRDLDALSRQIEPVEDALVAEAAEEAIRTRRERAFTHLLFARLALGRSVDAAVLTYGAALLPTNESLAAAAGQLAGDVGTVLVRVVRGGQLGWEREPTALLVAALWARRAGAPLPEGLLAQARIRARRRLNQEGEDAMVALHGLLDDPDLSVLVEGLDQPEVKEAARALTSQLVELLIGSPLLAFPERPQRETVSRGPVRRAAAKIGRNDPCPCGSGKKYKQCHEATDRDRLAESSDIAGLTSTELERDLEQYLTAERIEGLRGPTLARLDPLRVPAELRVSWIDQLGRWGENDAGERAIASWWPEEGPPDELLDDLIRRVIEHAARNERIDVAKRLVERRGGRIDDLLLEARLLLCAPEDRLAIVESIAAAELDQGGVELGFGLMAAGLPALGIHVARSELVLGADPAQGEALYAALVETRDELLVPPWDPIDDVLYTLEHGVTPEVDRELALARRRVDEGESSLRATQDALESLRVELERREAEAARAAQAVPAAPGAEPSESRPAPVDDGAVRELRERLERLKEDLKDRHRERNALRRELEDARAQVAELERARTEEEPAAQDEEDDEDEGDLDVSVAARIRVPVLPETFGAQLRVVPEATARAALVRLGELCAGFDTAFREVRPLRGFEGIWRVKIGRSYRLLFRPLEHTLEVVDLLHRQDLEKRLFRLRRGGEG